MADEGRFGRFKQIFKRGRSSSRHAVKEPGENNRPSTSRSDNTFSSPASTLQVPHDGLPQPESSNVCSTIPISEPPKIRIIATPLWARAFEKLEAEEDFADLQKAYLEYLQKHHGLSAGGHTDFTMGDSDMLARTQELAKKQLDELSTKQLTVEVKGKKIVVREQVRRTVKVINEFKSFIGSAIASEPHAALAWAGVLVALPFLENIFKQDEEAAQGFDQITFTLIRFCRLENQYLSSSPSETDQLIEAVKEKVATIYSIAYRYQVRIVLQYARRKPHQILRNAFVADGWKDLLNDVERNSIQVDKALQDLSFNYLAEHLKEMESKLHQSIKSLHELELATSADVKLLLAEQLLHNNLHIALDSVYDYAKVKSKEKCLSGTQRHTLSAIQKWVEDSNVNSILWLHGLAGTGKSCISRTLAGCLDDGTPVASEGQLPPWTFLGASFFFSHEDKTSNNTGVLVSTIARNLAERIPSLGKHISQAIKGDLHVERKRISEQINTLLSVPFREFSHEVMAPLRLIILIDALDECADQNSITELLKHLPKLRDVSDIEVKIFLTSRPEIYMQSGPTMDSVYPLRLNKVPRRAAGDPEPDDITQYIKFELKRIAEKYNLSEDWVSDDEVELFIEKADGLFIYAATICRFLDARLLPEVRRLRVQRIVDGEHGAKPESNLQVIYYKVLTFDLEELDQEEKQLHYSAYKTILGSITLSFEPISLSTLRFITKHSDVNGVLSQLSSIVDIPADKSLPLAFFHSSFRDYLLSEERSGSEFWVDPTKLHHELFLNCLDIMNRHLKEDICELRMPGSLVSGIPKSRIKAHIPDHLRYSCLHWINHLAELTAEQRRAELADEGKVYKFLSKKFLFWIETLSLVGELPRLILMLNDLEKCIETHRSSLLSDFIRDSKRFVLTNRHIIQQAPLQTYCSPLVFAPKRSIVRRMYHGLIPRWISQLPDTNEAWDSQVMVLEGHDKVVEELEVSHTGDKIISGSEDGTVIIWDGMTGVEMARYDYSDSETLHGLALSVDGRKLAIQLGINIHIRDIATGDETVVKVLRERWLFSFIRFSPKDPFLVSIFGNVLRIWDTDEGTLMFTQGIEVEAHLGADTAFSPDGRLLALGYHDTGTNLVLIWNIHQQYQLKTLKVPEPMKSKFGMSVTFSENGKQIACMSWPRHIWVFDVGSGLIERQFMVGIQIDGNFVSTHLSLADHLAVVACTDEGRIYQWNEADYNVTEETDYIRVPGFNPLVMTIFAFCASSGRVVATTGKILRVLDITMGRRTASQTEFSQPVSFIGNDENMVLVKSIRKTDKGYSIRIASAVGDMSIVGGKMEEEVTDAVVAPNQSLFSLRKEDGEVQFWTATPVQKVYSFHGIQKVKFSHDAKFAASVLLDNECIRIMDTTTWEEKTTLTAQVGSSDANIEFYGFSPNARFLACQYQSPVRRICIWDLERCTEPRKLIIGDSSPDFTFSPNAKLAVYYDAGEVLTLICLSTGEIKHRFTISRHMLGMAFDINGNQLAVADGSHVSILDTSTGTVRYSFQTQGPDPYNSRHIIIRKPNLAFVSQNVLAVRPRPEISGSRMELWDIRSANKVGNLCSGNVYGRIIAYDAFRGLEMNNGYLAVHIQNAGQDGNPTDSQSSLYVGEQWISHGFGKLLWIPPIYRIIGDCIIVGENKVAWTTEYGRVAVCQFDLNNAPTTQGLEDRCRRAWDPAQDTWID